MKREIQFGVVILLKRNKKIARESATYDDEQIKKQATEIIQCMYVWSWNMSIEVQVYCKLGPTMIDPLDISSTFQNLP